MSGLHGKQSSADGIHIITKWEFNNTADRDAYAYTADDVGGVARVGSSAPYSFFVLKNHSSVAWDEVGGTGIQLSNLSVNTAIPDGGGALQYTETTGVFKFTPADVSASANTFKINHTSPCSFKRGSRFQISDTTHQPLGDGDPAEFSSMILNAGNTWSAGQSGDHQTTGLWIKQLFNVPSRFNNFSFVDDLTITFGPAGLGLSQDIIGVSYTVKVSLIYFARGISNVSHSVIDITETVTVDSNRNIQVAQSVLNTALSDAASDSSISWWPIGMGTGGGSIYGQQQNAGAFKLTVLIYNGDADVQADGAGYLFLSGLNALIQFSTPT